MTRPQPDPVVLVLVDGLAWQVGNEAMQTLHACRAAGQASLYRLCCELPSLSRPLYECLLTGVAPAQSGITSNEIQRLSTQRSLFHLARAAGLRTAAAAYHWVSELYNRSPYEPARDRLTDDAGLPIQHGLFYHLDDYPDEQLFVDAEVLRSRYLPDLLLIHPMGVDAAGHRVGLEGAAYRDAARGIDRLLAAYLPLWRAAGAQVVVTSDHGMGRDGRHGGSRTEECEVPLWLVGDRFRHHIDSEEVSVRQTEICGILADLLGLPHAKPRCPAVLAQGEA